jgi:metal-responsive CopG/Arc/MetJ family transcriptional regulator
MSRILATISILATDRQAISNELNKVLTENGHLIMSRLGVNVQRNCLDHCMGLIILAVEGDGPKIAELEQKLKSLPHLVIKMSY